MLLLFDVSKYSTVLRRRRSLYELGIGHNTFRSRKDGDSQTVHHTGHLLHGSVLAQTGAAHAVQILDGVGFGRRIPLERDLDGRVALFVGVELVSRM